MYCIGLHVTREGYPIDCVCKTKLKTHTCQKEYLSVQIHIYVDEQKDKKKQNASENMEIEGN